MTIEIEKNGNKLGVTVRRGVVVRYFSYENLSEMEAVVLSLSSFY